MKLSNITVGFNSTMKNCVINPNLDTQFPISETALFSVKKGLDRDLIVIRHKDQLTVVHHLESGQPDITLKGLNRNGKWREATEEEIKEMKKDLEGLL